MMQPYNPIGVFDSGYGGLTILKDIVTKLPEYDYLYLGDNARAPYGPRSFETVYQYTLECVQWFFAQGCPLVILACNTASAKALRTIQQKDLQRIGPGKKVLGVIRPTTETISSFTKTKHIGILGTAGTVLSESYPIEIEKFAPEVKAYQEACPMWVPLIENNEHEFGGADFFIKKHLDNIMAKSPQIDTLLLACTHYPLLKKKIEQFIAAGVSIITQGDIVAESLVDYLKRHNEVEKQLSKSQTLKFVTTDSAKDFENHASIFFGKAVKAEHVVL
jgi:glutamate racemase